MKTFFELVIILIVCSTVNACSVNQQAISSDGREKIITSADEYMEELFGSFIGRFPKNTEDDLMNFSEIAFENIQKFKDMLEVQRNIRRHAQEFFDVHGKTKREESLINDILKLTIDESHDIYGSRDCSDSFRRITGEHYIRVGSGNPFKVLCNMEVDGGNWTIVQQRLDGSEDFNRTWQEYKEGFGRFDSEFWLGNDKLHVITTNGHYELRVDLQDFDGNSWYANYKTFRIGDEASNYMLHIHNYNGTAGDAMKNNNYMEFSARDKDNDFSANITCYKEYGNGGWWFKQCGFSNLNGQYNVGPGGIGVRWRLDKETNVSMKFARMMIRRIQN